MIIFSADSKVHFNLTQASGHGQQRHQIRAARGRPHDSPRPPDSPCAPQTYRKEMSVFASLPISAKFPHICSARLQQESKITICICDHQARDLLACVDTAAIIHNGKVVAQGTPTSLIQNIDARNAYFGESFKIN